MKKVNLNLPNTTQQSSFSTARVRAREEEREEGEKEKGLHANTAELSLGLPFRLKEIFICHESEHESCILIAHKCMHHRSDSRVNDYRKE